VKLGAASLAVDAARSVVCVVDIQDRLAAAMPEDDLARVVRNVGILLESARRFDIPVVLSQQYPRGLGATVASVAQAAAACATVHHLDKLSFGLCAADGFAPVWDALAGRDQWILCGMETHVCVYQTARQLGERGVMVQVPEDAVVSRRASDWRVGLRLMERAGALLTSTETVVFDLLGRAGSDDFKALSRLIK
jgi:nicotinamidase-related amidase